jgi:DNA-binding NarL/FixJ family response regulator
MLSLSPRMTPTRILVVDDHDFVSRLLEVFLSRRGTEWKICGSAKEGREAVAKVRQLAPDIVIMDLAMPDGMGGLEATREIKRIYPMLEILVFSGTASASDITAAFKAGARGCVLKSDVADLILPALEALRDHQVFLSPKVSKLHLDYLQHEKNQAAALTIRERERCIWWRMGKAARKLRPSWGLA